VTQSVVAVASIVSKLIVSVVRVVTGRRRCRRQPVAVVGPAEVHVSQRRQFAHKQFADGRAPSAAVVDVSDSTLVQVVSVLILVVLTRKKTLD